MGRGVPPSRAGDAGGPLQTSFRKVKYLRVVDPGPTVPTVTDIGEGFFHPGNRNVVTGENIRFADVEPGNHVVVKDGTGVDTEAMISTDTGVPVTETGFALNIDEGTPLTDGEEYTFEFAMVDSAGRERSVDLPLDRRRRVAVHMFHADAPLRSGNTSDIRLRDVPGEGRE